MSWPRSVWYCPFAKKIVPAGHVRRIMRLLYQQIVGAGDIPGPPGYRTRVLSEGSSLG